jgi:hypothetical protein
MRGQTPRIRISLRLQVAGEICIAGCLFLSGSNKQQAKHILSIALNHCEHAVDTGASCRLAAIFGETHMTMLAGIPYSVPVTNLIVGETYYATHDMEMFPVRYLGTDGEFDRRTIYVYEWLDGPSKGETRRSYSQSFWRRPTRQERIEMWHKMSIYEREKLLAGGYRGLRAQWFIEKNRFPA